MAKRFTDTNKYKKPFIRSLPGAYKLLWDYLYHDCDHAGIWIIDFEVAQLYIGEDMPINKIDSLKYFNDSEEKIIEIDHGKKWFIPSFVEFQYGELNPENRLHNSVINILKKYKLYKNKPLISPLQGAKDKNKEQDKDKDKERGEFEGGKINVPFETFWNLYDKKIDRKKCELKWGQLKDEERSLCITKLPIYIQATPDKKFRRDPETYLNNKSWENEIIGKTEVKEDYDFRQFYEKPKIK